MSKSWDNKMQTLVFKLALDPNERQKNILASHVGASRFAFNWAINAVKENWQQAKEDSSISYIELSAYSLRNQLNAVKEEVSPWWRENSKEAFASGTANASRAINRFIKTNKTNAKTQVGFPKFKTRHHDSKTGVTFTTGAIKLSDSKHLILPKVKTIKLHEKASAPFWLISNGGRISQVTVKNQQNRWFASINIKVDDNLAIKYFNGRKKQKVKSPSVGLDLGIKVFLADSEGNVIDNPHHLRSSLIKLRKANRRLARRRKLNNKTGELQSARWDKAHKKLVKAHAKITNQRKDFLHKVSKNIVESYDIVGIETLNISGMKKNRHLSLSISDAGWGEFKRQLDYKSQWHGTTLVKIDRFYPSSKMCSNCGAVKNKLLLSERIYKCDYCGLVLDRDYNAALNINKKAVAQSYGETLNERGGESSGSTYMLSETIPSETLKSLNFNP